MIKEAELQQAYLLGRQAALEKLAAEKKKKDHSLDNEIIRRAVERGVDGKNIAPLKPRGSGADFRKKYDMSEKDHGKMKDKVRREMSDAKTITRRYFRGM